MFELKIVVKINDLWYDLTKFVDLHPGGKQILKKYNKTNVTNKFYELKEHRAMDKVLETFLVTDEKLIEKYNKQENKKIID